MFTRDALALAQQRGLDLVEVAPNENPPVCKLMDYGKFKYEQTKKERASRATQKQVILKEVDGKLQTRYSTPFEFPAYVRFVRTVSTVKQGTLTSGDHRSTTMVIDCTTAGVSLFIKYDRAKKTMTLFYQDEEMEKAEKLLTMECV